MKKKILFISSFVLLVGCKSTPYQASQPEINNYFENQTVKLQAGEVEHKDHGKILATSEPYTTEFNECQKESFSGQSFMFGSLNVSDPKKLEQFSFDYMKKLVDALFSNDKKSSAHAGTMAALSVTSGVKPTYQSNYNARTIFDDKKLTSNIEAINVFSSKTLDCVKAKGWTYISKKKVTK
jgi:hypothetical protein